MKCVIIIGLALIGVCTSEDKYTDRYDDINVDEILSNKRLFTSYIKCLMDQGRCTPEGNTLKGMCGISVIFFFLLFCLKHEKLKENRNYKKML